MGSATQVASTAGDVFSVATTPENPLSWIKLAGDLGQLFGSLFGGGESSVHQGWRETGTLSAAGFDGNSQAWDQLGNTWGGYRDQGTSDYLAKLWANSVGSFDKKTIPIDISIPAPNFTVFLDKVAAGLEQIAGLPITTAAELAAMPARQPPPIIDIGPPQPTMADTTPAPTIPATSMPPNSAGTVTTSSSPAGGSSVIAAPVQAAATAMGVPSWALLIVAIAAAYWLYKRA